MKRSPWFIALIATFVAILIGCGGGGGGGAVTTNVLGAILWIETGAPTNPATTVRVGDFSAPTDLGTGGFSVTALIGATSLTATYAPAAGTPIVRTFSFPALTGSTDVGDLYIGPEEVSVAGRLVDSAAGNAIPNGRVSLAGRSATAGADGRFIIPGVAYSSTNLTVFLGLQGTAQATGFFTTSFSPPSGAVGGLVDVGDIVMVVEGGSTPPPLPFNLTGSVLPANLGPGARVEVLSGATPIRTQFANGTGNFSFWVPVGSYTIRATQGAATGSSPVNIVNVNQTVTVNVTVN